MNTLLLLTIMKRMLISMIVFLLAMLRRLSRCVWVHVFAYLTVFLRVLLFAGSYDNTVRLWEVATQRELAVLTGHTDRVTSVAFDGSGKYLASGGARGATSSSIAVFVMLLKRYFLRCIVRAQLLLRIVFLLFASISYCFDSIVCCFCVIFCQVGREARLAAALPCLTCC